MRPEPAGWGLINKILRRLLFDLAAPQEICKKNASFISNFTKVDKVGYDALPTHYSSTLHASHSSSSSSLERNSADTLPNSEGDIVDENTRLLLLLFPL